MKLEGLEHFEDYRRIRARVDTSIEEEPFQPFQIDRRHLVVARLIDPEGESRRSVSQLRPELTPEIRCNRERLLGKTHGRAGGTSP